MDTSNPWEDALEEIFKKSLNTKEDKHEKELPETIKLTNKLEDNPELKSELEKLRK